MKTIIHVNQHNIKHNAKHPEDIKHVFSCKQGNANVYGHTVAIHGPSVIVYRPNKPLPRGAKVWIETNEQVDVIQ